MMPTMADVSFGASLSNRAVVIGRVRAIELVEVAKMAEDSRLFDSAWVGDSIIAKPRLEAVAALSAIASRTERIKLGTACLATFAMRQPVLFAHQWASLDALSEGRSLLAVCLGGHGPQQMVDREAAYKEAKEFLDSYYSVDHHRRHLEQECVIGTPDECIERFVAYARAGCNVIIIRLVSWKPQEQLERWITEVIPEVRKRLASTSPATQG